MTPTPNFDRVARLYRWAEYLTLGPLLQRTRTHFLRQLTPCRQALVLGDGDGRFLAKLLGQHRQLHATAVDTSAAMLHLLRNRCRDYKHTSVLAKKLQPNDKGFVGDGLQPVRSATEETRGFSPGGNRLKTLQANALTITPPPATDLIVTHFFLDCLSQPEVDQLTRNLAATTNPGTLWILSDFRVPTGPLRPIARLYIRALYLAFRILTNLRITHLPDPESALITAGFVRIAHHQTLGGILYTELWQRGSDTIGSRPTMSHIDTQRPAPHLPTDALPDPEPAAPSLDQPDPGVFHHEPSTPTPSTSQQ